MMTKVAHTSPTSTDTPHVTVGPRPAFPAQAPAVQHLSHDLPHIPTARTAAGSYTRKQLAAAIANSADDQPWLPKLPGQRRSPEAPAPKSPGQRDGAYDTIVLGFSYDALAANAAFGSEQ